ncbi:MAG TPA: dienelactone hydrolase family protein, partial [Acidiferrobacteraceae bacterium]|nr:dienelactone hydrolase family protein [Acidiferrobacteraceae bacterium]
MKRTSPCELCLIILAAILAAMFSGWFSPARAAAVSLHRVLATTRSGMEVDVYRAGPASAAVGILLSPSRRGVTPGIKQWATLLGQAGYRVLVIDLYGGRTYRSQAHARAAFAAIKSDVLQAQERVGLRLLRAPGRKLVAMGWGRFGGTRALEAALSNNGVVGGVVLYDDLHHLPSTAARLQQLKAPVLGVYFADERRSARLQAFSEAMRRAHKPFY